MKKTLLMLAVAVGALAAAGIAWSSGVLGGGPAQIRVYGGGQIATPTSSRARSASTQTRTQTDWAPTGRSASPAFRPASGAT
jgi:hypothetical protein